MSTAVRTRPAGWIYVIHTATDRTKYVGQTVQPPWVRIERHRNTQRWGGEILPGRDGYTIIRRIDSYGDATLDAIALDLAEAEEIRRLDPTENGNRPDPAIFHARMAAALGNPTGGRTPRPPRPTTPTGRRTPHPTRTRGAARVRHRKPFPWGLLLRIPVGLVWAWAAVRVGVNVATQTGAAWWPWVLGVVAFFLGPVLTVAALRSWGWLPRKRRRRYK